MKKKKSTTKKKPAARVKTQKKAAPKAVQQKKTSSVGVTPIGDRVLVRPLPAETTTSFGIIIPDTAKEKPEQGTVIAVGPGRRGDDNELIPLQVAVGDVVMFSKYGYDEVKVDGTEYYLVREDSILAIIG